jgi:hypothetical protein
MHPFAANQLPAQVLNLIFPAKVPIPMTTTKFLRWVNTPPLMRYFLFRRLPAAWFLGLRVQSCDGAQAVVRLNYGWRSRNPFRSIYFAAQCAAG